MRENDLGNGEGKGKGVGRYCVLLIFVIYWILVSNFWDGLI